MRVAAKAAVFGLAGLLTLGVAGCSRGGGGGGTTTIIQQAPPASGGASSSSPTVPSVTQTPINDPKRLCNLAQARGQEIVNAIDTFWKLVMKDGWSWGDSSVSAAADNANQTVGKIAPIIEAAISNDTPSDLSRAIRDFLKASRDFSSAINDRGDNETLNPLNKAFGTSVDELKVACSK